MAETTGSGSVRAIGLDETRPAHVDALHGSRWDSKRALEEALSELRNTVANALPDAPDREAEQAPQAGDGARLPGRRTGFVPIVSQEEERDRGRGARSRLGLLILIGELALTAVAAVTITLAAANVRGAQPSDAERLVERISETMPVPAGVPSIAQLGAGSDLAGDPFFANAQPGDWLLLFADGRTAILYRDSGRTVVNIGHIGIGSTQTS